MAGHGRRRLGALLVTGALLGAVLVASVAAPATAAKPRCDGKVATIVSSKAIIRGTNKADVIVATGTRNNTIYGKGGNDRICAGAGRDRVVGGDGADRLFGGSGQDRVIGGAGADVLQGGKGPDTLKGGAGNDTLYGGPGQDDCEGGVGIDRLYSCNEPATTGTLRVTSDTTLAAPHRGRIVIEADGVRLDCAGHTITGPGSGRGIEVVGRRNVSIINCHPTNFDEGILVEGSSGILIRRCSANRNGEGIRIGDSVATLTGNVTSKNDTWGVILHPNTAGTVLRGNVADDNKAIGFALDKTTNSRLEANRARGNGTNFSIAESDGNTFVSNSAAGSDGGFHLGDSDGNVFRGNTAVGGTFALNNSSGNTFKDNTARGAAGDGFTSFLGSVGNTFRGNLAKKNAWVGFRDGSRGGSGTAGTDNTYVNNRCVGNGTPSEPSGLCR